MKDKGHPSKQAVLCVSPERAIAVVKMLRGAGYNAWSAPSLDGDGVIPGIVPDLVLLESPVHYLADLARSLWPKAVIVQSQNGDSTRALLEKVQAALKND